MEETDIAENNSTGPTAVNQAQADPQAEPQSTAQAEPEKKYTEWQKKTDELLLKDV